MFWGNQQFVDILAFDLITSLNALYSCHLGTSLKPYGIVTIFLLATLIFSGFQFFKASILQEMCKERIFCKMLLHFCNVYPNSHTFVDGRNLQQMNWVHQNLPYIPLRLNFQNRKYATAGILPKRISCLTFLGNVTLQAIIFLYSRNKIHTCACPSYPFCL